MGQLAWTVHPWFLGFRRGGIQDGDQVHDEHVNPEPGRDEPPERANSDPGLLDSAASGGQDGQDGQFFTSDFVPTTSMLQPPGRAAEAKAGEVPERSHTPASVVSSRSGDGDDQSSLIDRPGRRRLTPPRPPPTTTTTAAPTDQTR